MKRNTNFTNRLVGEDIKNKKTFFISQTDVGEVWYSKSFIQKNPNCYQIQILKKDKINNFKYNDTKDFVKKLIQQKKSNNKYSCIIENINKNLETIPQNLYIKFPLLFKNFLEINLNDEKSIYTFVSRYGLIGDSDNNPQSKYKENIFTKDQRIEPLLLWEYEQSCMRYALNLWDQRDKPKKLLSYFNAKIGSIYKIKSEFHFEENFSKIKTGDWSVNQQHSNLKSVSKNLVSLILQDHMEHRISLKTNFVDFETPTPVLEPDSLIGILWLQFLKYIQKKPKELRCAYKNCKFLFSVDNESRTFCSLDCKNKHHYAKRKKKKK